MLSVLPSQEDQPSTFMPSQKAKFSSHIPALHHFLNGPANMKQHLAEKAGLYQKDSPRFTSEAFIKFYAEDWKVGQAVKAKRTDEDSDLLVYNGVLNAIDRSQGLYEVKYEEGDYRVMPRSSIFPPTFASAVPNAEKWVDKMDANTLGLFMVDYPLELKKTPSTEISSEIMNFMYIGSKESSTNHALLKSLNISVVLRVHASPLPARVAKMYTQLGIKVYTIAIWDIVGVAIQRHWENAFPLLDACRKKGMKVLVHCEAGRSRSGSIGLAYVMSRGNPKRALSLCEALHHVRSCRDDVYPNPSFWKALIDYEESMLGSRSISHKAVDELHAYNWHYFD